MMEIQDEVELCFPQLLNSSCRKPKLHWSETVFLNMVLPVISLITVVLNLLVIISVSHFRHKQLHTPTNILLLSLAASDFLVGLLLLPGEIYQKNACWLLGDVLCSLHYCLSCHIVCTSVGSIVLISVDRYVAICDPLHYSTRITLVKIRCCICLCWLCSVIISILYFKDDLTQPGRSKSCFGECMVLFSYVAGIFDLVVTFLFPVTVIVVLYMRVFVVAVSQARAMRSHITALQPPLTVNTKKSELKASRTLGILVIVYLLCFCPYYFVSFAGNDVPSLSISFVIYLIYFNSCLNPMIYALFYPWFRRAIKLIVTLKVLQPCSSDFNILGQKG